MTRRYFSLAGALFFLFSGITAYAQQTEASRVDALTYRLYLESKWDSLVLTGRQASLEGHDFFYLHTRVGTAYYRLENFRMAAGAFERALEINTADPYTKEMLYYSYLLGGRNRDAQVFAQQLPESVKKEYGIPPTTLLHSVYTEGGMASTSNKSGRNKLSLAGNYGIYGEEDYPKGFSYFHLGMKHHPASRINIYLSFSHISVDMEKRMQYFHLPDSVIADTSAAYTLYQNQYYLRTELQIGKGWTLSPAFHFLRVQAETFTFSYSWDSTWYWVNPGIDTLQSVRYTYIYSHPKLYKDLSDYVLSLSLTREWKRFSFQFGLSHSSLNTMTQQQAGLSAWYYPYGNTRLYAGGNLTSLSEHSEGGTTEQRWIYGGLLGLKLRKGLWSEAEITAGDLTNFSDKDAYIVYNTPDRIRMRGSIAFYVTLSLHLQLNMRYQYFRKEGSIIRYTDAVNYQIIPVKYQQNNLIGGLLWKL